MLDNSDSGERNLTTVEPPIPEGLVSEDLVAFLRLCTNEELSPLISIIKEKPILSILRDSAKFKEHYPNHKMYIEEFDQELRSFGGNTFVNIFRRGGPPYKELVYDVCKRSKMNVDKSASVIELETALFQRVHEPLGIKEKVFDGISKGISKWVTNKGGLAHSGIAAWAGVSLATGAAPLIAGPLAAWWLADPNYSVTVPCVLHVANLRRQKLHAHIYRPWKEAM